MTWEAKVQVLENGRGRQASVRRGGAQLSWRDVVSGWRQDQAFRTFFIQVLADAPLAAYRFETPPVTAATLGSAFEFVLLDAPGLDRPPDPAAFADQLGAPHGPATVVTFPNLGGDAVLVVPSPAGATAAYGHLAAFVRQAPSEQVHALWHAVGDAMEKRIGDRHVWLSTAGMGVPWLHVRLDDRPKYYGFRPYARAGA